MRIFVLHSRYSKTIPSGENQAVITQVETLRKAGHEVMLAGISSDEQSQMITYELRSAWRVISGYGSNPLALINEFKPDIVHIHNTFPNYGSKWVRKLKQPFVVTLHNYRSICANGMLYRDGKACQRCLNSNTWQAVKNACYRDSALKTLPLAISTRDKGKKNDFINYAAKIVTLSDLSHATLRKYLKSNFIEKVSVVPNCYDPPLVEEMHHERQNRWIFAGRLTEEKGIADLVSEWDSVEELHIYGNGILESRLQLMARGKNIRFQGYVDSKEIYMAIRDSKGLVFPSKVQENCPIVFLQALAAGRTVISIPNNVVGEEISKTGIGIVVDEISKIPLASSVSFAEMCMMEELAAQLFRAKYSCATWLSSIEKVYFEALESTK